VLADLDCWLAKVARAARAKVRGGWVGAWVVVGRVESRQAQRELVTAQSRALTTTRES
jgi:hypothetical protein